MEKKKIEKMRTDFDKDRRRIFYNVIKSIR